MIRLLPASKKGKRASKNLKTTHRRSLLCPSGVFDSTGSICYPISAHSAITHGWTPIKSGRSSWICAKLAGLHVISLSLFGSASRGQAVAGSDLDFLVEFEGMATFDRYVDLKELLERI